MTFAELKTELYARGTDYLSEDAAGVTRAEAWLNQAYREIVNLHDWPFTRATASGVPPLTISDLRRVHYVRLTANPSTVLTYITYDDAVSEGLDPSQTGQPDYYYLSSDSVVSTIPLSTASIDVGYSKRLAPLTGTDTPIFDEEYHQLIVDRAMIRAYVDGDNFEAAQLLREEFNSGVQGMAEDYQIETRDVFYVEIDPYDG